jgi:hypothetical protein
MKQVIGMPTSRSVIRVVIDWLFGSQVSKLNQIKPRRTISRGVRAGYRYTGR